MGSTIGFIKEDTRSLDYGSHEAASNSSTVIFTFFLGGQPSGPKILEDNHGVFALGRLSPYMYLYMFIY